MYSIRDPNEYNGLRLNRIYNNCWTPYHTVICLIGFWSRKALAFYSVGNLGGRLLECLRCLTDDLPPRQVSVVATSKGTDVRQTQFRLSTFSSLSSSSIEGRQ